jgi:hypothetical protein
MGYDRRESAQQAVTEAKGGLTVHEMLVEGLVPITQSGSSRRMTPPRPPHSARCRYCDRPLTLHEHYSGGLCGDARCQRRHLEADLVAYRKQAGRALGETAAQAFPIVVVPHRAGRTAPVSPERREALETHLRALVRRMPDAKEIAPTTGPGEDALDAVAAVCGVCAGFCCYHGGTNFAFLDESTLARFAADHPESGPDGVAAAYLAHVPEHHYEGSCVYHTSAGCSLPRPMRAQICNEYECRGLRDARASPSTEGRRRLFVVARHDNRIVRGTFVDAAGTRAE